MILLLPSMLTNRKMRKASKNKLSTLKRKAWKIFSEYIRLRDKGVCFTCGVQKDPKEMDAGHFKHNRLDFDEMNIHCQCTRCNRFLHGNLGEYAIRLMEKYGKSELDSLVFRSNQIKKYTYQDLEEIIQTYKEKIRSSIKL